MATDGTDGGPMGRDDISYPIARPDAVALPPHVSGMLHETDTTVDRDIGAIDTAYTAALDQVDAELSPAVTDMHLSLAAMIGMIDTALQEVEIPQHGAIEKLLTATLGAVLYEEAELSRAGAYVPFATDEIARMLDDPTGAGIVCAVQGIVQDRPSVIADGIYTGYPAPPEIPSRLDSPYIQGLIDAVPSAPAIPERSTLPVPPVSPVPAPVPAPGRPVETPTCPPALPVDTDCGCPAPIVQVMCPPGAALPVPVVPDEEEEEEPVSPGEEEEEEEYEPDITVVVEPPIQYFDIGLTLAPGAPPPEDVDEPWHAAPLPDTYVYPGITWSRPTVCRDAEESIQRLMTSHAVRTTGADRLNTANMVSDLTRKLHAGTDGLLAYVFSGFESEAWKQAVVGAYRSSGDMAGGMTQASTVLDMLPPDLVGDKRLAWVLGFTIATAKKAAASTGMPVDQIIQPLEYLFQALYPTTLPNQAELDHLVLTGTIDHGRWRCLTRALGTDPDLRELVVGSQQAAPTVGEVQVLANRAALAPGEYEYMMALHGFTSTRQRDMIRDLSEYIPGPGDLVRFMVRDVFDPAAVAAGNLDKDFALKFFGPGGAAAPGPAARWAAAQGMTPDMFLSFWRAHWEYPSNTQLYEMLHRLRPDRPGIAEAMQTRRVQIALGGRPEDWPVPPVVTTADVRQVLEINDVAPAWVDALIAISYHPITRTDAIDAYHAGAFSEAQLREAMLDNGYTAVDADRLVYIQTVKRGRRLSNLGAMPSIRQVLRDYEDGLITGVEAARRLTPLVVDPAQRQQMLAAADDRVGTRILRQAVKRARRAFVIGEWDSVRADQFLRGRGVAPARVQELLIEWRDEMQGRLREPTARLIVQWAQIGLIQPDDAYQRVMRLGYSEIDSTRIVYQGIYARNEEIQGKIDKRKREYRQMVKDARQAKKEEEKALKDRQKEIEKYMKELEKEQARIQKELDARTPAPPG